MADPVPSAGAGSAGPTQPTASGEPDAADGRAGAAVAAARLSLAGLLGRWRNRLLKRNGGTLRESLEGVIEEHDEAIEDFSAHERAMLANILEFGDIRADDVMVPRADIVALEISTPLEDAVDVFNQAFHSRLPVYQATLDNPLGMVHIKDLMAACIETDETVRQNFTLSSIRRDILYVPPSMRALDLLLKMRTTRIHMALVIDEYGGTDGLLTIEDLVEEIVGDIEDEHDEAGPVMRARADGSYDADARVPLEEFERTTGIAIVPEDLAEEVDTVGGAVVALIGRVPQRGELIEQAPGLEIEIVDADPRTIKRLRVRPLPVDEHPDAGKGS